MKKTINDLKQIYADKQALLHMREKKNGNFLKVLMGESGIAAGAKDILYKIQEKDNEIKSNVTITQGVENKDENFKNPVIEVITKDGIRYIYDEGNVEKALEIFQSHAIDNKVLDQYLKAKIDPEKEQEK